ncbi:GNAT family N-acetyltransferase [Pontibacter arcticus]|uniref:N-acetyltransferase n=1 Tax=Pontibacter arcticus TaxID=2080288 RepID=A0A364RHM3_9BACT|nr:GNAT family protein [Pontibacter arcticus]RAU83808.1 N-acetyltransferase [Pontibacter arcticus]
MSFLYNTLATSFEDRIETPHLILRPYEEGDEVDFIQLMQENTSELGPVFKGRAARVHILEDARMQVKQLRTDWDNRKTFEFGVWQKETSKYIGAIALNNLDRSIPKAELGLYFTRPSEMQPFIQEAITEVIRFGFDKLGLNKIFLRCTAFNDYYGALATDSGFVKEGILRCDFRGADTTELLDLNYYGLTRPDYEEAFNTKDLEHHKPSIN